MYDVQALKSFKIQKYLRIVFKSIPLIIVLAVGLYFFSDYLANLPIERSDRNLSLFGRIKHGTQDYLKASWLAMNATQDDPKTTQLGIVELFVKGKYLDELNSKLPASGREAKKAEFKIDDKEYEAEAHYRGDSINHWSYPHKSWRVDLKKGKFHDGLQSLNLTVPRENAQMLNWLGYEMAKNFPGFLAPDSDLVHFRLNRKFDGVRLQLEQTDQSFLVRRGLPPGRIYIGDVDTEEIYGNTKRKNLYEDPTAWEVRGADLYVDTPEMSYLIDLLKQDKAIYRFYDKFSEIVDLKALTSYMAYLELVCSLHVDGTHNGKFYFNPTEGRFNPIAWDTLPYFWRNTELDLATNGLFRRVLQNPGLRHMKDQMLWKAIHEYVPEKMLLDLVQKMTDRMRQDIYAMPYKIASKARTISFVSNQEWEDAIKQLMSDIKDRNKYVNDELVKASASYVVKQLAPDRYKLAIKVDGRSSVNLDKIVFETEAKTIQVKRVGLEDLEQELLPDKAQQNVAVDNKLATFAAKDILYSKRKILPEQKVKIVPAIYQYELKLDSPSKLNIKSISAVNAITQKEISINEDQKIEIPAEYKRYMVWWNPEDFVKPAAKILSGELEVKEDIILSKNQTLEIQPGTTLKLAPRVSIIARGGKIIANGTAKAPIIFKSLKADNPWGAIVAQNNAELDINYAEFQGGTDKYHGFSWFASPVSIYNAKAKIKNSKFIDSTIAVRQSELDISDVSFSSIEPEAIYTQGSVVHRNNIKFDKREPEHNLSLLDGEMFGTPPRLEREYKYTVPGDILQTKTMDEISAGVLKELQAATKDALRWKSPQYAGNPIYADMLDKPFVFRDIYFDTEDFLNYQNDISYRLRNRYPGWKQYEYNINNPLWVEQWPNRIEFQAKVNRKQIEPGLSEVEESRFEFRRESKPFSLAVPPPPSPWELDQFIPFFEQGTYRGIRTSSGVAIMKYYNQHKPERKSLKFEPKFFVVTERFRQHLNIKSPWGSGPNPEQAYIVTLDRSNIYEAKSYLQYLNNAKAYKKKINEPVPDNSLLEIEIEYERNVSDVLDKQIAASKDPVEKERLKAAWQAFVDDQREIMEVIKEYFAKMNIKAVPADRSKYTQSVDGLKDTVDAFKNVPARVSSSN